MQPRGRMCVQSNGKIRCEFAESFVLYIVSEKHRPREPGRGLCLKSRFAFPVREGQPVRPERAGAAATAAAVFSVRPAAAGGARQTGRGSGACAPFRAGCAQGSAVLFGKDFIVQLRLLHAAALPPDHVGLVFRPVVEQQIFQCPGPLCRTAGQDGPDMSSASVPVPSPASAVRPPAPSLRRPSRRRPSGRAGGRGICRSPAARKAVGAWLPAACPAQLCRWA